MKKIRLITQLATLLVAATMFASPSFAMNVYLVAQEYSKTLDPDGGGPLPAETVPMWGFAESDITFSTIGTPTSPGPVIAVPVGDSTLSITLRNDLTEPISLVIPGQAATLNPVRSGIRVTALTNETDGGATTTYTWNNLQPGTFIYHSGSSLAKQVQMGLYGAVTVDANAGEIYPGVDFDNEVILFFSEIDPGLHDPPAFANSTNYHPQYFLINGEPYQSDTAVINAGNANRWTLVRMLSTALDDLVPTILGTQWQIIAEDGNPYPFAKDQHTTLLSALKTKDAIVTPTQEGTFTVFDRRGNLTNKGVMPGGMVAQLSIGPAPPNQPPVAEDDFGTTRRRAPIIIDVIANDSDPDADDTIDPTSVVVTSGKRASQGGVVKNNRDGTVRYRALRRFLGTETITYTVKNNSGEISNEATVHITVVR